MRARLTICPGEEAEKRQAHRSGIRAAAAPSWRREPGTGQRGQEDPSEATVASTMLCAKLQQKHAWSLASSILHLKLHRGFIFPIVLSRESRGMGKEHCKSFFAHLLRNLFHKQNFGELPSAHYPFAQGLAFNCGVKGPSKPDLPPLEDVQVSACPGLWSSVLVQKLYPTGLSTVSESPALDHFHPWRGLGVSRTQCYAGSES